MNNNKNWEEIKKENGENNFLNLVVKQLFYTSNLYANEIEKILLEYKIDLREVDYKNMNYDEVMKIYNEIDTFYRNHRIYLAYQPIKNS